MAALVKGFGCRPVVTYAAVPRAGVRKPPRKEPAGAVWAVCRLWIWRGGGLRRGYAGRRNRRRIDYRRREFVVAAAVDGVVLA